MDMVIVGEWMPITIFKNEKGRFVKYQEEFENSTGWWNTITAADFDNDGDEDWLIGNLGLNYKYKASSSEPFDIYANDFDQNGKLDIVLAYYDQDIQYPVRGKQCSSEQIPSLRNKFKSYDAFASASVSKVYSSGLLDQSLHYQAKTFASIYVENLGNGNYKISDLPFLAQSSSINSFLPFDYDHDGNLDVLCGGNFFPSEVETPRNDACYGWLLKGKGDGSFEFIPYSKSGLYVPYDIRKLKTMNKGQKIVFAVNDGPMVSYSIQD